MTLTKCCNAYIVRHTSREYPDGPVFHIDTSWDACESCHDEWSDTFEEEEDEYEEELHAYPAY